MGIFYIIIVVQGIGCVQLKTGANVQVFGKITHVTPDKTYTVQCLASLSLCEGTL